MKSLISVAATLPFALSLLLAPLEAADASEKLFKKCAACHAVGEGAKNKLGPQLNDLYGRPAGSLEDYKFSKAMVAKGEEGLVWDQESLTAFLAAPRSYIKGTKMSFPGIKKPEDIQSLLDYLGQFSDAVTD